MRTTQSNRVLSVTAAVALAIMTLTAGPALADGSSGHSVLRGALVGSMPAPASPAIAGINPGGAPWVNGTSTVRVREDGRISVKIRGLVIPPPRGTGVNPIAAVVASLVCGDMVTASTEPFALSAAGDGSTRAVISVPRHCDDPAALIQPAANRTVYIASAIEEDD
ncbi:MAG: hypothetical protein ACOH2F_00260 [Cellulomonas sp.]